MNGKFYQLTIDDRGVAVVTLNRPEVHNAFNDEFILELISCFESFRQKDGLRLVVLKASGKSFCAGADLNWMKSMKDYSDEENYRDSQNLAKLFTTINNCHLPVLALVNGAVLGGGVGIISCCDYVLATEKAKFGLTEVRLGLVPAVISPFVIAKIGESHARSTFLSGEIFNAHKALLMSLIHQEISSDDMEEELENKISSFLKAAPIAAVEAKKLVYRVVEKRRNTDFSEIVDDTCRTISRIRASDEGQEGMNSLLEKRKPQWMKL